eukprot:gene7650-13471_t
MDIITNINEVNDLTDLFEGDINLKEGGNAMPVGTRTLPDNVKRDAVRDRRMLWQSGIVPYEISSDLENFVYTIEGAMKEISSKSCIKFVKRTNEENWIYFVRRAGCWSSVGKLYWRPGFQEISLGNGCLLHETMVHEVLHALGFWHEQSRPDRDQYIEIFWENIDEEQKSNFQKYSHQEADILGIQYDYSSVMHYGSKAFSKNGKETMKPIRETSVNLGVAMEMSELDAIQLNALYDCKDTETVGWSGWSGFSPCNIECLKSRQRFCKNTNATTCEGANEYGVQTETLQCKKDATECYAPINGHWGPWGHWSSCSATCNYGVQQRNRECSDPAPQYNGSLCEGESTSTQKCKMRTCNLGPDDCEFDKDEFCHWSNDPSNSEGYSWYRKSGSTPSRYTGPSHDHTSEAGYYLYLEASSPASQGYTGRLISKLFESREERCMSFYYHMYGSSIGCLKVFFEGESTKTRTALFTKSGDQGDKWKSASILLKPEENYKIIFEGERGIGFRGDIAIDDVTFKNGSCPSTGASTVDEQNALTTAKPLPHVIAIGCYRDEGSIDGKRPFPQYVNYREQINWSDMTKTISDCALKAKEFNSTIFAIEFYGECWFGPESEINYARDGLTTDCWNGVGKARTMMVYRWSS